MSIIKNIKLNMSYRVISNRIMLCVLVFGYSFELIAQNLITSQSKKECSRLVTFGDIGVCLSIVDGMVECYNIPEIKEQADIINGGGGSALGFYLPDSLIEDFKNQKSIDLNDYFLVSSPKLVKNISFGLIELDKFRKDLENNYVKDNWSNLKAKFENIYKDISVSRPVLLKSYSLTKNSSSFIFLTKYITNGKEYIRISITNIISIKNRMIQSNYFKYYTDEKSIYDAKSKNDYMVYLFLEDNQK